MPTQGHARTRRRYQITNNRYQNTNVTLTCTSRTRRRGCVTAWRHDNERSCVDTEPLSNYEQPLPNRERECGGQNVRHIAQVLKLTRHDTKMRCDGKFINVSPRRTAWDMLPMMDFIESFCYFQNRAFLVSIFGFGIKNAMNCSHYMRMPR